MTLEILLQILVFPALAYISIKVSDIRERLATVEVKVTAVEKRLETLPCETKHNHCD